MRKKIRMLIDNTSTEVWPGLVAALGCILCGLTSPALATTLDLNFVDTVGHPVIVAKAELLLVAWGETKRIELETMEHSMRLPLDSDWLRSRWPEMFDHQEGVYLYLQAPPLASVRSHQFKWLGSGGYPGPVKIAFPDDLEVVVAKGDQASATISLRQKAPRRLRIVDTDGVPLPGTAIDSFMFWSQSNHCAALASAEPLDSHVSNADGWIEIQDGDFEYALELKDRFTLSFVEKKPARVPQTDKANVPDSLHKPGSSDSVSKHSRTVVLPWRLVSHFSQPETVVVVHRAPSRPLEIVVHRSGKPVAGLSLQGYWAACPCGACSGPIATTDEAGRIFIKEFHPDVYRWVRLFDDASEVWGAEPASSLPMRVIEVDLTEKR